MEEMRIALLGKTGVGKTSLAATIFGDTEFEIHHTANPGTSQCQKATGEIHGKNITMIDTPGFFDNRMSELDLRSNITRCIVECSPGPHAFLILLKVERYTEQENDVISKIRETFSEEAFRYAVVVFTHGDQLPEGMQIEEFVGENEILRDLLERCGGRCHVIDNKYWNNNQQDENRSNQRQVEKLLNTITEMVNQNHEGFYTNDMLQAVEREVQAEAEHIQSSSPHMSWENIMTQARNIFFNFLKYAAGITTGMLLGALLGIPVMVAKVVTALKAMGIVQDVGKVAAAVAAGAAGAKEFSVGCKAVGAGVGGAAVATAVLGGAVVGGAVGGGVIGYREAVEADSILEAVTNTAEAVSELAGQEFRNMFNTT